MLIISRKKDEKIIVADNIEITILEVGRNRVRFGISAPKDVIIETHLKIHAETPEAVEALMVDDAGQEMPSILRPSKSA